MKVKLYTAIAGGNPGDVVELPEAQARGLIIEGHGEKVTAQTAAADAEQTSKSQRKR